MTENERREAARQFIMKWAGKGKEDEDARSYWLDILQNIQGASNVTDRLNFEKKVIIDGNTKRIDVYIPETRVIIEQKSLGIPLDQKIHQSGDVYLSPYEQAKNYNDNLPYDEKARWIVTSNFAEIWIYDMNVKVPTPLKLRLADLRDQFHLLDFLLNSDVKKIIEEVELSIQAGALVGRIHDRFLEQYSDPMAKKTQNSLNILCVRLVFCLYAEDARLFGPHGNEFTKYIGQYEPKDIRQALLNIFKVLDTPVSERDEYLADELAAFPYVNGGLFANENIVIPKITQEIKDTLIESANFNWVSISPTIFGAVFESTLNPETRRSGGMHYTSIENIHKVIDPLFLDDLKEELKTILAEPVLQTRRKKLEAYQVKLASLKFLDPACGSGNFLTETYTCIRRLENEVISALHSGQIMLGEITNPIQVSISQFYGIEINDFAVTVAKTALWIAESQMLKETENVVHMELDFLPLKTNANIVEGNALQMDWNKVVSNTVCSYLLGNPPFVGYSLQSESQKKDVLSIYVDESGKPYKTAGKIDYVACWYFKAAQMIENTNIKAAFVSTNSICQGEQVASVWKPLFERFNIHIDFAYRTFRWDSEANIQAHVHCVIVGFSATKNEKPKRIYVSDEIQLVKQINAYLIDAPIIFVESKTKPFGEVPEMIYGNKPTDGGYLFLSEDEKNDAISAEPNIERFIKQIYGASEYINNIKRYCLWLVGVSPADLRSSPFIMDRVNKVRDFRLSSTKEATRRSAETPSLFQEIRHPDSTYIIIPRHSSENRRYIPFGFLPPSIVVNDAVQMIPAASLLLFGILISNVHMAWTRIVCGRIKSDYRYSKDIVYNNFPWPSPTDEQKAKIEQTAQSILDARALYLESSLADLYDPLTMPPELRKAHQANDKAVMQAYGFDVKNTSESDCVAALMKMYQQLTEKR